jgi:hypothetical protein
MGLNLNNATYVDIIPFHSDMAACPDTPQPMRSPSLYLQPLTARTISSAPFLSQCVTTGAELQAILQNKSTNLLIDVCTENITFLDEILVMRKNLIIQCMLSNATKKCILDAKGKTRHFTITSSNVTFKGLVFLNGNAPSVGDSRQVPPAVID